MLVSFPKALTLTAMLPLTSHPVITATILAASFALTECLTDIFCQDVPQAQSEGILSQLALYSSSTNTIVIISVARKDQSVMYVIVYFVTTSHMLTFLSSNARDLDKYVTMKSNTTSSRPIPQSLGKRQT